MNVRTIARSLVLLLAPMLVYSAARAQSESDVMATDKLSVGLGYAAGATVSLDPATNWKVVPSLTYRVGVDATYPITDVIGATLGLGLDKRALEFRWYLDPGIWERRAVNYFTVSPGVKFSAFHLGLNIGFPMSATRTWQNGPDARENAQELDPTADTLNVLLEPHIGAIIPIVNRDFAWFGLTIQAGYALNNMSERFIFSPGQEVGSQYRSTQAVSFRLGVTGQFGIPGTDRRR